jgi:hypothetical protein
VLANCAAEDETPGRSEFESCLVVPIVGTRTVMMGALELRATRPSAFDARAVEILQLFGAVVAGGIECARLKDEVRDKHRIDSEFMVARQVMEELIPRTIPTLSGFDIAGVNEASFEAGGDCYEFIPLPDERWGPDEHPTRQTGRPPTEVPARCPEPAHSSCCSAEVARRAEPAIVDGRQWRLQPASRPPAPSSRARAVLERPDNVHGRTRRHRVRL